MAGTGILDIERSHAGSVVRRAYATSPLRFLTPRSHGDAAWVYAGSYGGGLLGGDALQVALSVGPHARAFVSTQASTKVYRSDRPTSVEITATVSSGGQLVLWPDPVVCFAGSTYQQTQQVELAAGAALILVDSMSSGRRASGERWLFDRYTSRLTVRYDDRLVLLDSLSLSAEEGCLATRMGRFDVLCTAAIVGSALVSAVEGILMRASAAGVERTPDTLVAAAPLSGIGCVLRIAGRSVEDVQRVLRDHLSFVSCLLGDDPWARKW